MKVKAVLLTWSLLLVPDILYGESVSCTPKLKSVDESILRYAKSVKKLIPGNRYFSTNHKTGSVLSKCLAKALKSGMKIKVDVWNTHVFGGFSPTSFQVNFVRNPFLLVHSGFRYHKMEPEAWTKVPYKSMGVQSGVWQGAQNALATWKTLCIPGSSDLYNKILHNMTYATALNTLNSKEGLVLESIRALYRDIPYMLRSAKDCNKTNMLSPGSCRNIFLDVLTDDFEKRIVSDVGCALNLPTNGLVAVTDTCNAHKLLSSNDPSDKVKSHITSLGSNDTDRVHSIELLRRLDGIYLNGMLRKAELELNRYVLK